MKQVKANEKAKTERRMRTAFEEKHDPNLRSDYAALQKCRSFWNCYDFLFNERRGADFESLYMKRENFHKSAYFKAETLHICVKTYHRHIAQYVKTFEYFLKETE